MPVFPLVGFAVPGLAPWGFCPSGFALGGFVVGFVVGFVEGFGEGFVVGLAEGLAGGGPCDTGFGTVCAAGAADSKKLSAAAITVLSRLLGCLLGRRRVFARRHFASGVPQARSWATDATLARSDEVDDFAADGIAV